jgi:hypothetical protein
MLRSGVHWNAIDVFDLPHLIKGRATIIYRTAFNGSTAQTTSEAW